MQAQRGRLVATVVVVVYLAFGCGTPSQKTAPPGPFEPPISIITSSVVIDACPDAKRMNPKLATKEIEEEVDSGDSRLHFLITFLY